MTLPEELREPVAGRLPGWRETARPAPAPAPRLTVAALRRFGRRHARALLGRAARRGALAMWRRGAAADGRFAELTRRVERLVDRQVEITATAAQTEANRINLELLKAEVRALQAQLDELGMAFAPATGLAGAGQRFAEQREQLGAIERRLRQLDRTMAPPPGSPAQPATSVASSEPVSFDYVGFERRFRGDPVAVRREQARRYAEPLLDGLPPELPVVDLGCGRGELLAELRQRGASVLGVDTDQGMLAEASERGVPVQRADAVSFLRAAAPGSLGALFCAHLAEHLALDDLLALVSLAVSRLRPGGLFVAETPNPASLIVLGNSYVLDPTHVRALHPALLSFLCESAGFRDVRLRFYSPATDYHLPLIPDAESVPGADTVNTAFRRLNEVLFGPQDYAVFARTAP